jgi:alcohol dehydrogenase class IV
VTAGSAFEFGTANRIVFGAGRSVELPTLIQGWGRTALVCTGSRPERYRDLIAALPIPAEIFRVVGEPTVEMTRVAVEAARSQGADVVVAIGGGSALDLGKAVAMLLGNGGDPLDYLEVIGQGRPITAPAVPFIAVPTTAGTGAEVTANAVLASPEHGRKASLRSELMIPRVALVDPLLTLDCPPSVTATSGLDALTQCLEPYVSVQASPLTDALAAEGLRLAATGLRAAYADGSDAAARTDMALASLLGGMSLANAKLGAVHGFAGVIGGMVEAAHGAICAALLAAVVEVNVTALRDREPTNPRLDRYRTAAQVLTGDRDATVEVGVDWIRETVTMLGIPGLAELGVRSEMLADIVAKTGPASSTRGNPIVLTDDELRSVLARSMG